MSGYHRGTRVTVLEPRSTLLTSGGSVRVLKTSTRGVPVVRKYRWDVLRVVVYPCIDNFFFRSDLRLVGYQEGALGHLVRGRTDPDLSRLKVLKTPQREQ